MGPPVSLVIPDEKTVVKRISQEFVQIAFLKLLRFFTGDQREFSSNRDASARMHSEVRIVGLATDNPRVAAEKHIVGESQEVDDNGNVLATDTASNLRVKFSNLRGSQTLDPNGGVIDGIPGSIQIDLEGAASLPLHAKAPDIDAES
jgi:hypothetical protein